MLISSFRLTGQTGRIDTTGCVCHFALNISITSTYTCPLDCSWSSWMDCLCLVTACFNNVRVSLVWQQHNRGRFREGFSQYSAWNEMKTTASTNCAATDSRGHPIGAFVLRNNRRILLRRDARRVLRHMNPVFQRGPRCHGKKVK